MKPLTGKAVLSARSAERRIHVVRERIDPRERGSPLNDRSPWACRDSAHPVEGMSTESRSIVGPTRRSTVDSIEKLRIDAWADRLSRCGEVVAVIRGRAS
jgi:hypothetical protein